jgi:Zn-dependent protease
MLLFMHVQIDSLRLWILNMAVCVCAIFISVLVHELGHAFVFRHIFSVESDIMLHGMGGVTIPLRPLRRYYGAKGMLCKVFLSAAGCLAGFVLAAGAYGLLMTINVQQNGFGLLNIVQNFLSWTMIISIVWGIFNLLPIYPLDGGQIFREIFLFFSPRKGLANSLVISMVTAGICVALCVSYQRFFIALLAGFLAYQNYLELTRQSFRY